jgi:beta-lactamase regulating signal transducer with metallopeptidase domain
MNNLGTTLLWGAVQVSIFSLTGATFYLVARRRGPATGSLVALAAVLLVFGVSLLTLSPWPHWWSLSDQASERSLTNAQKSWVEPEPVAASQAALVAEQAKNTTAKPVASSIPLDSRQILQAAWSGVVEGLHAQAPAPAGKTWHWQGLLAGTLIAGMCIGLVRLLVGLATVARYRRHSCPVDDADLSDCLAIVCAELGYNRPVAIHESSLLDSPAVVGWLRPLILIPETWRVWTPEERQAVLAHEMGHVTHNDYLSWIIAQLSLIVNFYNPLVHWLVTRLRMEQELAADGSGARLAGGRETYLRILAGMALRQDNRRTSWAARPFLPARGTFLRRIEMLRDAKWVGQPKLAVSSRLFLLGALTVAALFVAGLRAPLVGKTGNLVAASAFEPQADKQKLTGEFIPPGAMAAVAIRVPDILRLASGDEVSKLIDDLPPLKQLGLNLKDLDIVKVSMLDVVRGAANPHFQLYVRTVKPFDWLKAMRAVEPSLQEAEFAGAKYLSSPQAPGPNMQLSFYMPDDRTLVGATEARLRDLMQAGGKTPRPAWADGWDKVATGSVVGMLNVDALGKLLNMEGGNPQGAGAVMTMIAPLWQNSRIALFGINVEKTLRFQVVAEAPSAEAGKKLSKNIQALATVAENFLESVAPMIEQAPADEKPAIKQLLAVAKDLLGQLQIKQNDNFVDVSTHTDKLGSKEITGVLLPAIRKARQSAQRSVSANNLKQIALAMHNYHDVHGHFPPAVVMGPDGKTPHSWRVEILPYLEQNQLFQAYKMDEPWDGPNNRKLLDKMPRVFNAAQNTPTTFSSYYGLTGNGAFFDGAAGTSMAQITDGTSNTIMAVEAKRDIPWTKPEDIAYDATKPLPKFGGYFPEGYNVVLCDGSVRFIMNQIAEQVLRALITKNGGEVIPQF